MNVGAVPVGGHHVFLVVVEERDRQRQSDRRSLKASSHLLIIFFFSHASCNRAASRIELTKSSMEISALHTYIPPCLSCVHSCPKRPYFLCATVEKDENEKERE